METRKVRGAEIVESGGVTQRGELIWLVPSQSHKGKWMVDYTDGKPTCTCPDYEKNSAFCKHIFAVELIQGRLPMSVPTPPTTSKPKYTQDWPAYNAAQVNERAHFEQLLHALCQGIVTEPQPGRGRPKTPLADVVYALTLKVYEGMSGRRSSSEVKRASEEGLLSKNVAYNTISDYMSDPKITPLLRLLVQESAAPLAGVERTFAVDSTGFGTHNYDRWVDEKWGTPKKRQKFVKAHAICGTKTHVVTDLLIDSAGDATMFKPLLDATGLRFKIEEVSADKAYSSRSILAAVIAAGAVPYIPFKDGTKGGKQDLWSRMFHYYSYKRADFDEHYHRRSNVETVFSMVKAKFGAFVRSKSDEAQVNELYCKYLCHNIAVLTSSIYEFGLVPEFWKADAPVAIQRGA